MISVTIQLHPETEEKLRDKAQERGQTVETYLAQLAEQDAAAVEATALTPEQKAAAWLAWVAGHKPLAAAADDSREDIYAGRGE